mmetsp:Transcript_68959/g.173686  ORF Transcript_68959/g.173686 Transcript_68959/m.173686 type:complete len:404 (+) Transcript_68959:136-1347(+)
MQQPVDLPCVIAAFAADASRSSLELPADLSAAQRREAKQIADRLGGLKCESYGFGAERQLHLFKKSTLADGPAADAVRIKNTFIDDWLAAEGSGAEPPMHRSLPPGLFGASAAGKVDLFGTSVAEMSPIVEASPQSTSAGDASTTKHRSGGSGGVGGRLDFGFAAELPELPEVPGALKYSVKDTFIHIDCEPLAEQRAVQSMPDGSFQRHLQAELAAMHHQQQQQQQPQGFPEPAAPLPTAAMPFAAPVPAPPCTAMEPLPATPALSDAIVVGSEVVIEGLMKLPAFNGRSGIVTAFDADNGRYTVVLDAPADGHRNAKVKRDNLRHRLPAAPVSSPTACAPPPPPPQFAPTLLSKQGLLATGVRVACAAGVPQEDSRVLAPTAAAAALQALPVKPLKLESLV